MQPVVDGTVRKVCIMTRTTALLLSDGLGRQHNIIARLKDGDDRFVVHLVFWVLHAEVVNMSDKIARTFVSQVSEMK